VRLHGGLGNQLFQYATARSLTQPNDYVYTDHNFFKRTQRTEEFIARQYELGIFKNLKARKASDTITKLCVADTVFYRMLRQFSKPAHIIQKENELVSFAGIKKSKCIYLDGYFQSEKYFKHIRNQLLNELQFPPLDERNTAIANKIKAIENAVSIHVRRDDYLIPRVAKVLGILPLSYYYNALNILKLQYKDLSLFFFSDDMQWAKENFNYEGLTTEFIDFNSKPEDSWKDMALMSFCKHHILANSSFSWWGAWLSGNEGKTFAPYNWFNTENISFNIHDVVPRHWNVVQYE
jgi:hypothetical protein